MLTATAPLPRPTATPTDLDRLAGEAHRLWQREPAAHPSMREALLTELTELDLVLERLALRAASSSLGGDDIDELARCDHRMRRLRRHWSHEHRPATSCAA